jgi:PHD/YefM family antitoxin component YafN of YafNO toxin-antitoxin module
MELNKRYAALMLMEILYERGLVNRETLQAAREKFEEDRRILLAA